MKHGLKINDFLLIAVIVFISLSVLFIRSVFSKQGGLAIVYEDNKPIMEIRLDIDGEHNIYSYDGGDEPSGVNTARVRDGKLWIEYADCPDGICVSQGKISKTGESIICLPHHKVIVVERGEDPVVDGISGR